MSSTSTLPGDGNSSAAIWDEKHFKALLGLPRFPLRLLQEEPWRSWLEQHGGLSAVRSNLLSTASNLSAEQRELLRIILDSPSTSTQYYADQLNVSSSTYFRQMSDLAHHLIPHLNSWESGRPNPDALPSTNLPALLTPLIGADDLLAVASSRLMQPNTRLLTITGPGGVGKTRFAIQLATELLAQFQGGVYFVPLASVTNVSLLVAEIVRVLEVEGGSTQPLEAILKAYLRDRRLLLLLDSFEHLIDAAPTVADLLWQAPKLQIVVTSREVLHLSGEHRFEIPVLATPDPAHLPPVEQLAQCPSVCLFVDRAQAVMPGFTLTTENAAFVAEVCCCLDGLPLAIELAAARIKLFPPEQMLSQMQHGLDFLRSGPRDKDTRHQTLWNTIDWSYTLLSEPEKALFRRLAVFAHEWSLEAAQVVCDVADAEEGLENLLHKSLVQFAGTDSTGSLRFQMLQTIHEYARQKMRDSGEEKELQKRHASYYLAWLEDAERFLGTPQLKKWTVCVRQEHNNLRAVLTWSMAEEPEMALQLIGDVLPFWEVLNVLSEGRRWAEQVLSRTQHLKIPARAKALRGTGWLAISQNDHAQGEQCFREALALAQELEDGYLIGTMLQGMGEIMRSKREYDQARAMFGESLTLFRELGDNIQTAWSLDHLGRMAWHQGDAAQARLLLEEAVALFQSMGFQWGLCMTLEHLGRVMLDLGEYRQAQNSLEQALVLLEEYGTRWHMAWTLGALGRVMLAQEDYENAQKLLLRSLGLHKEVENDWGVIISLMDFAALSVARNNYVMAVQLSGAVYAWLGKAEESALSETVQILQDMEIKILPLARSDLNQSDYDYAWEQGKTMSLDEVIVNLR
ncbi:MAG: tetratricopeptide repeat protein [Anaerolineae bacterium]|nr:tetratricopeptide repeat protein [Anaerolineae bacterium]